MLARVSERGFVRSDSTTPASVNISTVQQHVIKTKSKVVEMASARIIKREISKCAHHDHPVRYPCADAALHRWLDMVF
jgi:predicted Mrr-cat superfamily restriction endonuclease